MPLVTLGGISETTLNLCHFSAKPASGDSMEQGARHSCNKTIWGGGTTEKVSKMKF
jgi:hypothetical protein